MGALVLNFWMAGRESMDSLTLRKSGLVRRQIRGLLTKKSYFLARSESSERRRPTGILG